MKTLKVAFIGPPNSGKSTVLNELVEENLLPVCAKVQTTYFPLSVIYQEEDLQVCCYDTPGWVKGRGLLDQQIRKNIQRIVRDVDLVISLGEPPDFIEFEPIAILPKFPKKSKIIELFHQYAIETESFLYPEDDLSMDPARLFFLDNVRAVVLNMFEEEVPYEVGLQIRAIDKNRVFLDLIVNRPSQKAIVLSRIGKLSKALKAVLYRTFGGNYELELFVRVEKNWMKSPEKLREFGYV